MVCTGSSSWRTPPEPSGALRDLRLWVTRARACEAHLAYVWHDGTPRVVPVWFHWTGDRLVLGTPPRAPKLTALRSNPHVAVTIDTNDWPARALMIRGEAELEMLDDVVPEYATAAHRYFGEAAAGWLAQLAGQPMARITVTPRWVGLLDFETRFPSALSA